MSQKIVVTPGHLINRIARISTRWVDERFQPLGLASAQMPVLYALKDGSSMTQKELATLAQIEQPTMAQLLARMERDGLIRRTANPEDKRSALISLTPNAQKKLPTSRAILREGDKLATKGFTDRELATFKRLLMRFLENVDPERQVLPGLGPVIPVVDHLANADPHIQQPDPTDHAAHPPALQYGVDCRVREQPPVLLPIPRPPGKQRQDSADIEAEDHQHNEAQALQPHRSRRRAFAGKFVSLHRFSSRSFSKYFLLRWHRLFHGSRRLRRLSRNPTTRAAARAYFWFVCSPFAGFLSFIPE